MKNLWLLVVVVLMVGTLLAAGCGIPQEDYDAMVAERDAAKAEVASLQSELRQLEGELSRVQADYDASKQTIDKVKAYGAILDTWLFVPAFDATTEQALDLSNSVGDIGDKELTEKLVAWMDTGSEEVKWEFFFAIWDGLWEQLP